MKFEGEILRARLLDTGHLSAAENIAWDAALLRASAVSEVPVLRFLRFCPSCVLVGRFQSPRQEVRIDYVSTNNIDVNRRITGGGAIYFDSSQLGWEVFGNKRSVFHGRIRRDIYRKLCEPVCEALGNYGISACFRPRNDIEVSGRKISGTGGVDDGDGFMFQGTLLYDNCAETLLRSLRVPAEKLGRHGVESIAERVVFFRDIADHLPSAGELERGIGDSFERFLGIKLYVDEPTSYERELFAEELEYRSSAAWIYERDGDKEAAGVLYGATRRTGTVFFAAKYDATRKKIASVNIWGDFFCTPDRWLLDLEASLAHSIADSATIEARILEFYASSPAKFRGIDINDITRAAHIAISKRKLFPHLSYEEISRTLFVNIEVNELSSFAPTHFFAPYCSKLLTCEHRYRNSCSECGGCSVGDGYSLAFAHGLTPVTIRSFENLLREHKRLRDNGSDGYIGCCCEEFYIKHYRAFRQSGLRIVLVVLNSQTCYDLSQSRVAYKGKFQNQTEMNVVHLEKVFALVRGFRDGSLSF